MAANVEACCIKCNKNGGILKCNSCKKYFCFKHVNEHKDELEKQLEDLINQENQFENDLSKDDESNNLFNEIDLWKKINIEQIKQIAKQAKQDLKQFIKISNENLLNKSQFIKNDLQLLKQSDDLSETKLNYLNNQFQLLKKQIDSFQLIKSSNSNFLKIEKQQQQQQTDEISQSTTIYNQINFLKTEQTNSKSEGSILIREIDPYGYFIIVEHNGLTTNREQDMIGWTLKRSIDSYKDIIYKFPNNFILKPKSFIKILSRQASQTLYSYEKENILIAESIQSWGTGINNIINYLTDANGDHKHILTQTF